LASAKRITLAVKQEEIVVFLLSETNIDTQLGIHAADKKKAREYLKSLNANPNHK